MMTSFAAPQLVSQTQANQSSNSLISTSGEDAIYIGIGGLAIGLALIVGIFSRRFMAAVFVSLALSAFVILLVILA